MEPLISEELDADTLALALEDESKYERIWLPPEPWWDALVADKAAFALAIHRKLVRGARWPRSATIDVRKPGHGIRPVSLISPEVRVAYRAIASALVPPDERADRSAARYADFVVDPIRAAFHDKSGVVSVGDATYSHVLIADIAAFYQYIDHAILRDELDRAGRDVDLVDGVVGLLADIEGRSFGIPQRSAPSDWLSECYAARVERWVIRDGFDVWRYNDDFRIGCTSYAETLRAIESLSRASRDIGLVLNDGKTATPPFLSYLIHNSNVEVDDASAEIDPDDVEAAVSSDYAPEDDDQALEAAAATFDLLWDPADNAGPVEEGQWNLLKLNADQHRAVRRALNTFTKHGDARAIPQLLSILAYQPAMTHLVIRYATIVAADNPDDIGQFLDWVIERLSLNEWQRAWVAYGFRSCDLQIEGFPGRGAWLHAEMQRVDSVSAAEAAVTLATLDDIDFSVLEAHLRAAAADFSPWYLHAIGVLKLSGSVSNAQIGALRQSSALAASILK